jgi:hypothetical protein
VGLEEADDDTGGKDGDVAVDAETGGDDEDEDDDDDDEGAAGPTYCCQRKLDLPVAPSEAMGVSKK